MTTIDNNCFCNIENDPFSFHFSLDKTYEELGITKNEGESDADFEKRAKAEYDKIKDKFRNNDSENSKKAEEKIKEVIADLKNRFPSDFKEKSFDKDSRPIYNGELLDGPTALGYELWMPDKILFDSPEEYLAALLHESNHMRENHDYVQRYNNLADQYEGIVNEHNNLLNSGNLSEPQRNELLRLQLNMDALDKEMRKMEREANFNSPYHESSIRG